MSPHAEVIRLRLAGGPQTARQLADFIAVSQPTVSRALGNLGAQVVRFGATRSIHYALRDTGRGLPDTAVYRVDAEGRIRRLGVLIAVRPEGFVMHQDDGETLHSAGLPWWLLDMRPQGYLGRAFASRHGAALGLPPHLGEWNDNHALHALLAHGDDATGNLLLGEVAREHFLSATPPEPISMAEKAATYAELAAQAARGEAPGSSAGGEQPKFTAYAETPDGPRHVIVKFSEAEGGPVSERWRDLLLAEHLALTTLREAGVPAATTRVVDFAGQRFLEVERFDRVGPLGRRALFSLGALDAEFTGLGSGWARIAGLLANEKQITAEAASGAALLWAFGSLIGNADMHPGNLSFLADHGRPYALAPTYDMTPMAFRPRSGGGLPDGLAALAIDAVVDNATWRRAETLAREFLARVETAMGFSARFAPCIAALRRHIETVGGKIARLG